MYLLVDGHGSTRQVNLHAAPGSVFQRYAYDAYGNMLKYGSLFGNTSGLADTLMTSHLYSGEQTDALTGMQYLRARYYDPTTGRFNRVDPFAGNTQDPQSLHKYAYAHTNPVMGVDPSGLISLTDALVSVSIATISGGIVGYAAAPAGKKAEGVVRGASAGFLSSTALVVTLAFNKKDINTVIINGIATGFMNVLSAIHQDYWQNNNSLSGVQWGNYTLEFLEGLGWGSASSAFKEPIKNLPFIGKLASGDIAEIVVPAFITGFSKTLADDAVTGIADYFFDIDPTIDIGLDYWQEYLTRALLNGFKSSALALYTAPVSLGSKKLPFIEDELYIEIITKAFTSFLSAPVGGLFDDARDALVDRF